MADPGKRPGTTGTGERTDGDDDALPLHVTTTGQGRPILFLHGFGMHSDVWKPWIDGLRDDHELYLVDMKGAGRAPKPNDGRYSPLDHAALVARLVVERDLRDLTLVGHSLGGGVVLLTALELHDRGESSRITRLVSVAGVAYRQRLPPFVGLAELGRVTDAAFAVVPKRWLVRRVREDVVYDPEAISPEQVEPYARVLRSPEARRALLATARQLLTPDLDRWMERYSELDHPTLALWGAHDPVVPIDVGRRLVSELPRAKLVVLERCGHIPTEERPDASLRAFRRFLEETAPAGERGDRQDGTDSSGTGSCPGQRRTGRGG